MTSPLVRRLRLGDTIRELRRKAALTADELGHKAGLNRLTISRLETAGRRTDIGHVMKCLDALGVKEDSKQWRTLVRVARDAVERGWWETPEYAGMGGRQARIADIETGATAIRDYQPSFVAGLLQTEAFMIARNEAALSDGASFDAEATVRGRLRRQDQLNNPDSPHLDVVVEEQVIRRLTVPAAVMVEQLRHLLDQATTHPKVSVHVLPVDAELTGFRLPRSPFCLYTYPDPGDPTVVVVDTVTEDLLILDAEEAGRYTGLFDRLRDAALSEQDSADYIRQAAETLAAQPDREVRP